MIALANAGLREIAPDYRGYGISDPPPEPEEATLSDLLNDLLGILDALDLTRVFLMGKDFGARHAYFSPFCTQKGLRSCRIGVSLCASRSLCV